MQAFFSRAGAALLCLLLAGLLVAALFWALSIGTVDLPPDVIAAAILDQLTGNTPIETAGKGPVHDIVWLLRLPRLLLAAIIGAGLATCGVIMQAIVKNPLADPYILGISAGAAQPPPSSSGSVRRSARMPSGSRPFSVHSPSPSASSSSQISAAVRTR